MRKTGVKAGSLGNLYFRLLRPAAAAVGHHFVHVRERHSFAVAEALRFWRGDVPDESVQAAIDLADVLSHVGWASVDLLIAILEENDRE